MGAPRRQYPGEIRKVLRHADRLSKLLVRLERNEQAGSWVVGRSGELRAVVSCTIADLRAGVVDGNLALDAITSYVDGLHRDAAKRLRCGPTLECCKSDDAITIVPYDEAPTDAASSLGAEHCEAGTVRAGWKDAAEVLDRFHSELALVEIHARALARRLGTRSVTMDDLRGFGREGLLDAARSYDERHATPFSHWATLRIRRSMVDGVRRWGTLPRRVLQELKEIEDVDAAHHGFDGEERAPNGVASALEEVPGHSEEAASAEMSLSQIHAGPPAFSEFSASPEELVANAEMHAALREIMTRLSDRERNVVEGYFAGRKLKELGAMAGATESWASRVLARALVAIRRDFRSMKPF
jgi:RNA polymerase sigma factor for flagellar operon FliA